jgi:uncharacterized membrane protein
MLRHPIHPMLVHLPVACWLLAPASDAAALAMERPFFWHVSALLCLTGLIIGAVAAMFGAMELERIKGRKDLQRLAIIHASLMGSAWVIALIAMIVRIDEMLLTRIPAPLAVPVLDAAAAVVLIAGAFFGGEMVYGHGVGVKRDDQP